VIELKPTNGTAASFWVHCDDSDVYSFGCGLQSQWEFPFERRYRKGEKDVMGEIEEMSRAIIKGKCGEKRGWFSLKGWISVGDYTYRVTNLPKFPIPPIWTRRYAPYVREQTISNLERITGQSDSTDR
jgi:hypothetical protein